MIHVDNVDVVSDNETQRGKCQGRREVGAGGSLTVLAFLGNHDIYNYYFNLIS